MAHYSGFTSLGKLMVLTCLSLFFLCSCGTIMLPPLEVVSCKEEKGSIFMEFSLPPDFASLKKGLSITEDGKKMEGEISISGNKAHFTPTYGIKKNREYVVRIEAGTEDARGHSLMEAFVYKFFTGNNIAIFTVEIAFLTNDFQQNNSDVRYVQNNNQDYGEFYISNPLSGIQLNFSQPVDRESLEKGLSFSPNLEYFLQYEENDCCVRVIPKKELDVNQRYLLSLAPTVMDIHRNFLPKEEIWSFYHQRDTSPPQISFKVLEQLVENQGLVSLAPNEWIILDFSEKVNLDRVSSYIFLEPEGHSTIAPALEIIGDYKTGKSLKLRPKWHLSEQEIWGKKWRLVVQPGIEDLGGNSIEGEQGIILSYTLEKFRPPQFLGALMMDKSGLEVLFSPSNPFLSMVLPQHTYGTAPETLPSTVELHLFFKVSSESKGMNEFSLMEHTSLYASNGCCNLTIKTLESLDNPNSDMYKKFLTRIQEEEQNILVEEEANAPTEIVTVSFFVELVNKKPRGLVTLEISSEMIDSLGNKLGKTSVCQVNKL